LYEFKSNFYL